MQKFQMRKLLISFNSFEDETNTITYKHSLDRVVLSIPLWMKLFCGMLVLHTQTLSIPLWMKQNGIREQVKYIRIQLSIPLWMKLLLRV